MKQILTKTAQAIGGTAYGFYFTAKTIAPPMLALVGIIVGGIALLFGLTALLIWIN